MALRIELAEGVAGLPREQWNRLVGADGSPFLEWEWLASLEDAGTLGAQSGWSARPLVAREDGRLLAACPLYVKGNSEGEFVFDWNWADAAHRAGIEYYPKLLVGIPFTPVTGARFLVAPDQDRSSWIRRLGDALREICKANRLSSVHVNFCLEDEASQLEDAAYELRLGVQYHWYNRGYRGFEDYLAELRSKRRNQARRELRSLEEQGIRIRALVGDQIPPSLIPAMFRFYLSTLDKKYYGRQYLNQRFFELIHDRFRSRLCFIVAWHGDRPVAGTFNVQKGDALYGRYWGALAELRHLHFNVCYYAAIQHCIEAGIGRFEPGAGGDYKQLRGFDATPTRSVHFLVEERFRRAVARFLERERAEAEATIDWMRERSALKPER